VVRISAMNGDGIGALRAAISELRTEAVPERVVSDLVEAGDIVVMVMPGTTKAPKGGLEPLHSALFREILDAGCMPLAVREQDLPTAITSLTRAPSLVIADSRNLDRMLMLVPPDIPLTTFSVLMARRKGNLSEFVGALRSLSELRAGERVLVVEGCEHRPLSEQEFHRNLPATLRTMVGGPLDVEYSSGCDFPETLDGFQLVIHCNACSIDRREMLHRQGVGRRAGAPVANIGILEPYFLHALPRILKPLRKAGVVSKDLDDVLVPPDAPGGRAAADSRPQSGRRRDSMFGA
jgi:hypothetical protein